MIDLDDYEKCNKYHWNVQHASGKYSYKYYGYSMLNGKRESLHRFLMNVNNRKEIVDHINGIESDNRKSNLRVCSLKENLRNIDKRKNNKSGYKGVIWYPHHNYNKWKATIKVNYKTINLGYFDTIKEAVEVRNQAKIKYFGEFARVEEYIELSDT